MVEREAVEREGEQGRVADEVSETRARRCARRAPSRSGRAPCAPSARRARRIAPARDLDRVVLAVAVGRGSCGGFGTCRSSASRSASAAASASSAARSSSFTRWSSSAARASACPSASSAAQLVDLRGRARASARRQRAARRSVSAAPFRASAARKPSGSLRAALRSIMTVECRNASITRATPSSSGPGQIQSAARAQTVVPSSTEMPNPAHSIISTSFSPSPKRRSAPGRAPAARRRTRRRSPSRRPGARARGATAARWSCRDGRRNAARAPRARPARSAGSPTATSLVGGRSSQASRSPTSLTGMCWNAA